MPLNEELKRAIERLNIPYSLPLLGLDSTKIQIKGTDLTPEMVEKLAELEQVKIIFDAKDLKDFNLLTNLSNICELRVNKALDSKEFIDLPENIEKLDIELDDHSAINGRDIGTLENLTELHLKGGRLINGALFPKNLRILHFIRVKLEAQPNWLYLFDNLEELKFDLISGLLLDKLPRNLKKFEISLYDVKTLIGIKELTKLNFLYLNDTNENGIGSLVSPLLLKCIPKWNEDSLDEMSILLRDLCDYIVLHLNQDRKEFAEKLNDFFKEHNKNITLTQDTIANFFLNEAKQIFQL